jgi:hypothetical protein
MTDDWTPEKEEEDDPIKLQKEQLAIGKEFLSRLRREDEEKKAREAEYAAQAPAPERVTVRGYKPPTFEEVSAGMKKAWDEVERIMPNATNEAKSYAFQTLVHAQAAAMTGFPGA